MVLSEAIQTPDRADQKTVLIADDDARMRLLLEMTLAGSPFQLLQAGDGAEALAMVRTHHPDVILLDAEMPKVDGFEVCRLVKADPATKDVTVIMLTAKAQEDDRARGVAVGADGYLTKPFSPRELRKHLETYLGAR